MEEGEEKREKETETDGGGTCKRNEEQELSSGNIENRAYRSAKYRSFC